MLSWYHACSYCTAKWFSPLSSIACPRCGTESQSREQLAPPWQSRQADQPKEQRDTSEHTDPKEGRRKLKRTENDDRCMGAQSRRRKRKTKR